MTTFFADLLAAWRAARDTWTTLRHLHRGGNPDYIPF